MEWFYIPRDVHRIILYSCDNFQIRLLIFGDPLKYTSKYFCLILSTTNRRPTRGAVAKKSNHVYFLLQVFWVILLFDINVVLMPTMVT